MTAGLAIVVLRGYLVRLIKRLKSIDFYLVRLATLLLLIDFFLAITVHLQEIMLIKVLLIHQLV